MFRYDDLTNKVELTKGDNAEIIITLYDKDGHQREIFSDDVLTLTVKKDNSGFSKIAQNGVFYISPDDTKHLKAGTYKYDIQIKTFTDKIYTVIPPSTFELMEEVTV